MYKIMLVAMAMFAMMAASDATAQSYGYGSYSFSRGYSGGYYGRYPSYAPRYGRFSSPHAGRSYNPAHYRIIPKQPTRYRTAPMSKYEMTRYLRSIGAIR